MSTCQRPSFSLNKFISTYLHDIRNYKQCLPAEEERKLIQEIKSGNSNSFNKLFFSCQYIVIEEVLYYYQCNVELTDLIQEANMACLTALKHIPTANRSLKNYLHYNIFRHLENYVKSNFSTVRYPINVIYEIESIKEHLNNRKTCSAEYYEITNVLNELEQMTNRSKELFHYFFDLYTYQTDTFINRIDLDIDAFITNNLEALDVDLMSESLKLEIDRSCSSLTERESDVVTKYYGLNSENALTLDEIGCKMNLTRERIRQILEKALIRLRHSNRSKGLADYLSLIYPINSLLLKDKPYYLKTRFEDYSYAVDLLKNYVKPYKRVTSYPNIDNLSAECRRLVKKILLKEGNPLKAEEIKYQIWELYPAFNENIITYAINTHPELIKIKKGFYALVEWGYFEDNLSEQGKRVDREEIKLQINEILLEQNTPISITYLFSKLNALQQKRFFSDTEERIIKKILASDKNIIKTLDGKFYYFKEEEYEQSEIN